jgi:hypothetical protein
MKVPEKTRRWLLDSNIPRVRYRAKTLFEPEKVDPRELLNDPLVIQLVDSLGDWETQVLKRHDKADLGIHRLALLADLGMRWGNPSVRRIVDTVLKHLDERGLPLIRIEIPTVFGGSGTAAWNWMACDFPNILYALAEMRVPEEHLDAPLQGLVDLVAAAGLPCCGSNPKIHGPGKRGEICPYASLLAAKALSRGKSPASARSGKDAAEALLRHWEQRGQKRIFLFGIGTEFQKLKFPLVWYNLLHVLEVLSRFQEFHDDRRFQEMVKVLIDKADDSFRFTAESMYRAYSGYDFADKKQPSPTLTAVVLRILGRVEPELLA